MKSIRNCVLLIFLIASYLNVYSLIEDFSEEVFRTELWTGPTHSDHRNDRFWQVKETGGHGDNGWVAKCNYNPTETTFESPILTGQFTLHSDGYIQFWYYTYCSPGLGFTLRLNNAIPAAFGGYTGISGIWLQTPQIPIQAANSPYKIEFIFNTAVGHAGYVLIDDIVITGASLADASATQTHAVMGERVYLYGNTDDAIFYDWTNTAGTPAVTIENDDKAIANFRAPSGLTAEETYTFQLIVDNHPGVATATHDIKIGGGTSADAGPDQKALEGATVNLDGSNSATLSAPWTSGLAYSWAVTDANGYGPITLTGADTATPSFTAPNVPDDETVTITLTLTVNNDYTINMGADEDVIFVKVFGSDVPVADAGPDQTLPLNSPVTISGTGTTASGTITSYTWEAVSADAQGLAGLPQTGAGTDYSFNIPNVMGDYEYTFRLTVLNSLGNTDTDTVTVYASTDPIADAGDDFSTRGNGTIYLDGSGSYDPEGGELTYAWTQTGGATAVTWVSQNVQDPSFTIVAPTPPETLTFRLEVTDEHGNASAYDFVDVKVYDNDYPMAAADASPLRATAGETVQLDASGSTDYPSVPYTSLTYSWNNPGVTYAPSANVYNPSFAAPNPGANVITNYTFTVTADDGTYTDDADVIVRVYGADAPHADAGKDITGTENKTVTLNGSGSYDPNGDAITYTWAQTGGPDTFDFGTINWNDVSPSFSVGNLDNSIVLEFTLTILAGGTTDTDTVIVILNPAKKGGGGDGGCSFSGTGSAVSILPLLLAGLAFMLIRRKKN